MNSVILSIATVSECDAVISKINGNISDLTYKRSIESHKRNKMVSSSADVLADLAAAQTDLANCLSRLATMPEGIERENEIIERDRLTYRVSYLNGRKRAFDSSELIESECDIAVYDASITSLSALLADAEARKTELVNQAPAAA
jgi:hypothetical protein